MKYVTDTIDININNADTVSTRSDRYIKYILN